MRQNTRINTHKPAQAIAATVSTLMLLSTLSSITPAHATQTERPKTTESTSGELPPTHDTLRPTAKAGYCTSTRETRHNGTQHRVRLDCPTDQQVPVRGVLDIFILPDLRTEETQSAGTYYSDWAPRSPADIDGVWDGTHVEGGEIYAGTDVPINIAVENQTGHEIEIGTISGKVGINPPHALYPPPPPSPQTVPTDATTAFSVKLSRSDARANPITQLTEYIYDENLLGLTISSSPTTGELHTLRITGPQRVPANNPSGLNWKAQLEDASQSFNEYRLRLSTAGPGLTFKITVEHSSAYTAPTPLTASIENFVPIQIARITGTTAPSPVYRVDIPPHVRSFTETPAAFDIAPYVIAATTASGATEQLGELVPTEKPAVDYNTHLITYPAASFFIEQTKPDDPYTTIQVQGYPHFLIPGHWKPNGPAWCQGGEVVPPCTTEWIPEHVETDTNLNRDTQLTLANAKTPPPANTTHRKVTAISAIPTTGEPVERNGLAQEPLRLEIRASGSPVNPDEHPELVGLYKNIYYRNAATGQLITGLYQSHEEGGYTAITNSRGPNVNAISLARQTANNSFNDAYVSTTQTGTVRITAHLNLDDINEEYSGDTTAGTGILIPTTPINDTVLGSIVGLSTRTGIVDPRTGAYHTFNARQPRAQLITRYSAMPSTLPTTTTYPWQLDIFDGIARITDLRGLEDTPSLRTTVISGTGTHINALIPN